MATIIDIVNIVNYPISLELNAMSIGIIMKNMNLNKATSESHESFLLESGFIDGIFKRRY